MIAIKVTDNETAFAGDALIRFAAISDTFPTTAITADSGAATITFDESPIAHPPVRLTRYVPFPLPAHYVHYPLITSGPDYIAGLYSFRIPNADLDASPGTWSCWLSETTIIPVPISPTFLLRTHTTTSLGEIFDAGSMAMLYKDNNGTTLFTQATLDAAGNPTGVWDDIRGCGPLPGS